MSLSPRSSSLSSRKLLAVAEEADSPSPDPIKVVFDPDPVITGYTMPVASSTISRDVTATVTPKEETKNIKFSVGGVDRITFIEKSRDNAKGKVVLTVKGKSPTPSDKKGGDTQIVAKKDSTKVGEVNAIVKIPKGIGRPHPQRITDAEQLVTASNQLGSSTSSPAYVSDPPLPAGDVHLWTVFCHYLTVPVDDQFEARLDDLYAGVKVEERDVNLPWTYINQDMTSAGTYSDPVGLLIPKSPGPADVAADSAAAEAWLTGATMAMPTLPSFTQFIAVAVGGHLLAPSISNREVQGFPPDKVRIIWR
jgi:hypothetical protein